MQNSFDTLPDSFDLDAFEHTSNVEDFKNKCVDEDETQPPLFDEVNSIFKKKSNDIEQSSSSATNMENFSEAFERTWTNIVGSESDLDQEATEAATFDRQNTNAVIDTDSEASASQVTEENLDENISESESESESRKSTLNLHTLAKKLPWMYFKMIYSLFLQHYTIRHTNICFSLI